MACDLERGDCVVITSARTQRGGLSLVNGQLGIIVSTHARALMSSMTLETVYKVRLLSNENVLMLFENELIMVIKSYGLFLK